MKLLPFFVSSLLTLAVCDILRIPMIRKKSPRQLMIEADVSDEQFKMMMGHGKPKPKPRTNDTIALYKFLDGELYGIIRIGHPGQEFHISMDTTWVDSWVFSKYCPNFYPACATHRKYNALASSTYLPDGRIFKANIGNTTIEGILSIDNLNVGHLIINKFTFAEIQKAPLSLIFGQADGIFGMAPQSDGYMKPFFYELYSQKLLPKPIFSFYLNRDHTTEHAGAIFLGGYDKKHFNESTLFYLPLTDKSYWQVKMERMELSDGVQTNVFCKNGCNAMIDVSSRVTWGPYEEIILINRLLGAVEGNYDNRYVIDCESIPKLPSLNFTMGAKTFHLHGKELVQEVHKVPSETICLSIFSVYPGISSWVIGSSFLERMYVICDMEKGRIGLANTV